ncbi:MULTISPECIES: diguanylate cyclase [unclassified Pseudomonas]|uniref:diguanylate cyclase n=1 Tax=unclassified Pseudomonas TaxID=196821 RepID=UPI002AC8DC13|nr:MULTISPECIES: diguanylate cyclase [unclassified Pseudomonas]MEB0047879.1 diguanylate cyclase [Pseudomonas sp. Dout3]MEB0098970.1 diguanylate cyclase [Pseudomonas sp. DC1.2]WPX57610.1 diguanylate cyclase [Pseudomonas sp. DC1.2]
MEKQHGKGLSFAKRIYLPRIIGLSIGSLSVAGALYPLNMPTWVWVLLLFNGFFWPHLAYQLSIHSSFPYQAERRNLLYDSLCGGFWAATFQFNPLPAVTILSMMTMNNVAAGGRRLFLPGVMAQAAGVLISWALFGAAFTLSTTQLQIAACLPMLTLYPLALGMVCYQLAIKLSEHKRTLKALSRTDSLTGLLNHGAWKDLLHFKFQQCRQKQEPAAIALIDIDHFKAINDTYGHIVGDSVLRQLSTELQRTLRESDLAGRYGGDEFCVILPNMALHQACDVMERLQTVICDFRHQDVSQLRVSLSIGLAAFQPSFADAIDWLDDADKALYAAKNTVRNKISLSETGPTIDTANQTATQKLIHDIKKKPTCTSLRSFV